MTAVLDFSWKMLFFVSIFSVFYFIFSIASLYSFKILSSSVKMSSIKFLQMVLLLSFLSVGVYVGISDHDLVADCFGRFAETNGVFGFTRSLSSIWLLGVLLLIARDLMSYFRIRRQLLSSSHSIMLAEGDQFKDYTFLKVGKQFVPTCAGFFKPRIFIPEWLVENRESLNHILAHESVHLRNHDGLWSLVSVLIHRLNWFNPLSYGSLRSVRVQLELATDEQAVKGFSLDIADYAKSLVAVVAESNSQSLLFLSASGTFVQTQERLAHLKRLQNGKSEFSPLYAVLVLATVFFGLSEAYASIKQPDSVREAPMCFQVRHEVLLENWISGQTRFESNKCQ